MAKVVFKNNNINDIFNGSAELKISGDQKRATYADGLTAGELEFLGSNLARAGNTEYFSGGTIRQLRITDENNEFAFRLTGADTKAKDLPRDYTSGDLTGLLSTLLNGRDKIYGSKDGDFLSGYGGADKIKGGIGDDFITGGAGNDVLIGGPGTDTFHFVQSEDGRSQDVIRDFDIVGSVVDHLFVEPQEIDVDRANGGRDTLLTLWDGQATVLLEDIRKNDLLEYFSNL